MLSSAALLRLIWLASPALPVGGFSYSEGLEAAVESGHVTNEAQAGAWLLDQLHLALVRADLSVVAQSFSAWQQHDTARIDAGIAAVTEVVNYKSSNWRTLREWAHQRNELTARDDQLLLFAATAGRVPSERQAAAILQIRKRLEAEGFRSAQISQGIR